jgi:hypothetical protein
VGQLQSAQVQVAHESVHDAQEQVLWLQLAHVQLVSVHNAQIPSHDPQEHTAHSS